MNEVTEDRDQTDVLRAALAASESRFHSIIERNADGVLVVRPAGTIRSANPAAFRLVRRSQEELIGRPFGIPIVPGEDHRGRPALRLQRGTCRRDVRGRDRMGW
ncbi:MAG: PAS domain-containing protein [Planctomycetaceae bacterium]|nr:PAS domain-containing protein [Planctomycetaceae bacterium]